MSKNINDGNGNGNNISFDTNKYLDLMITSMMMKNSTNSTDSKSNIISSLLNFVIMMCADDIKILVKFIVSGLIDSLKACFPFFGKLFIFINSIFIYNSTPNNYTKFEFNDEDQRKEPPSLSMNLLGLDVVKGSLFKLIKSSGKYSETIVSHDLQNDKTFETKRILHNIVICHKKIKIEFVNSIEFLTYTKNKNIEVVKHKISDTYDIKKLEMFSNLLPKQLQNIIDFLFLEYESTDSKYNARYNPHIKEKQTLTAYIPYAGSTQCNMYIPSVDSYYRKPIQFKLSTACINREFYDFACNFKTLFNMDVNKTFYHILLLNSLINLYTNHENCFLTYLMKPFNLQENTIIFNHKIKNNRTIPSLSLSNDEKDSLLMITDFVKQSISISQLNMLFLNKEITNYFDFVFKTVCNLNKEIIQYIPTKNTDCIVNVSQNLDPQNSENTYIMTDSELESEYCDFVEDLFSSIHKRPDRKIGIYLLTIEHQKIVTSVPNPKYKTYIQKKNIITGLLSSNDEKVKNLPEIVEFLKLDPEPEEINEITYKSIPIAKEINSKYKNISRLYLKEKSKEKLMANLINYKKNKELLEELGMQNQLGIALYGDPGTGKSSTILAVASELGKDIFYLDFESILTNDDLSVAVNYITKQANNSIMVCEDIDCACPIVLRRTFVDESYNKNIINNTINNIINNDQTDTLVNIMKTEKSKLTLEYFLNILQGTLTVDDFICIITTNHIDKLDPAFIREGRFNVQIELTKCDHYQIKSIFNDFIGREIKNEILSKIQEFKFAPVSIMTRCAEFLLKTDSPDDVIMQPFLNN